MEKFSQAAELLTDLYRSLNDVVDNLQTAVGIIRPSEVTAALSGVAQATETAALRVLDEAEALQDDQQRLSGALQKLRGLLPEGNDEAKTLWEDAAACSSALSARAMKLISAMEFQDLASQHIGHSVQAINEVRDRLSSILSLVGITTTTVGGGTVSEQITRLGSANQELGSRQAIADELFAANSANGRGR